MGFSTSSPRWNEPSPGSCCGACPVHSRAFSFSQPNNFSTPSSGSNMWSSDSQRLEMGSPVRQAMAMRRIQPQALRDAPRPIPRMGLLMPAKSFRRSYDSAHWSVDDSLDLTDLQNELSRTIDWEPYRVLHAHGDHPVECLCHECGVWSPFGRLHRGAGGAHSPKIQPSAADANAAASTEQCLDSSSAGSAEYISLLYE
ncbi:uncharacterized protein [Pleurodeles waltl]|uniref:uncharacterized protein isoform X4 n=1 Tax=Pleurodeles waltl TaxID=8319 RepID=UPI0037099FED